MHSRLSALCWSDQPIQTSWGLVTSPTAWCGHSSLSCGGPVPRCSLSLPAESSTCCPAGGGISAGQPGPSEGSGRSRVWQAASSGALQLCPAVTWPSTGTARVAHHERQPRHAQPGYEGAMSIRATGQNACPGTCSYSAFVAPLHASAACKAGQLSVSSYCNNSRA